MVKKEIKENDGTTTMKQNVRNELITALPSEDYETQT